jgi:hypothetical protein
MRIFVLILVLSGCNTATIVNYPGKNLPDKNAPITDPSKPGTVSFKIFDVEPIEDRRADAYERMHDICNSSNYTILKEGRDPHDSKRWLLTFKCN